MHCRALVMYIKKKVGYSKIVIFFREKKNIYTWNSLYDHKVKVDIGKRIRNMKITLFSRKRWEQGPVRLCMVRK